MPDAPPRQSPLSHQQILVVFSGLVLTMLLAALDSTIVATALPTIVGELGGLEHLAWVVTGYLLAQTIVTPLYGKLGDLYGRKRILQIGIVIFLAGSALCGLSRTMTQLILFRFVQGLGGGGLMVTAQAVVGDVVPPRDRGRYQGIFGAVFGVASIAGPLLGGYFTTHWSWRWIFYINLPLGIIALLVLAATLPGSSRRVTHAIDYAGAVTLAIALSGITIMTDLGGAMFPWGSPQIIGLGVVALISFAMFIRIERRAVEPVLPPRLFADRTFTVSALVGMVVGFALFGSVTYLPMYLQVVKDASPTGSGLQMLPQMGGMLLSSIISGQLISRTGHYKKFPVTGMVVLTLGLLLLSRMTVETSMTQALLSMLVLGLGLGMVMQVLVLAIQNSVEYRDLGVATSGAVLFRFIGGSLGTATLGAVFASRLAHNLAQAFPGGAPGAGAGGGGGINPEMIRSLPTPARLGFQQAFTHSLETVFLCAASVAATGFLLSLALPARALRASVKASAADPGNEAGDAFVMPRDSDSATTLEHSISLLADRQVQRGHLEAILERASVSLSPAAAFLLIRLERNEALEPRTVGHACQLTPERMDEALRELVDGGYVTEVRDGVQTRHPLTDRGCTAFTSIARARRERLTELTKDWPDERRDEVARVLARMAAELVPDRNSPDRAA